MIWVEIFWTISLAALLVAEYMLVRANQRLRRALAALNQANEDLHSALVGMIRREALMRQQRQVE